MAQLLKWWHQYSMFVTLVGYVFMLGVGYKGYSDAIASSQAAITNIVSQHDKENVDHRVTVLEQIAQDNRENFSDIKDTEKAIFQRLNNISDGR
jgi:hypothetical protein